MLRIKALGCLTVLGPDGPILGAAAQPKRMALLALLARAGERGVTRDKVLGYFWPDAEEDRARRSLANAVWALRRDLGAEDLFLPGNDLRLNPDVIGSDVADFEEALAAGDGSRAATLYEGPFLDGFRVAGVPEFERWADAERAALSHAYAGAVGKLARDATARADHPAAIGWWRKLVAQDPLNSRHALGLMQSLAATGDRSSAIRHAQIYEALVEQELDLPPDREVVELARKLREPPPAAPAARVTPTAEREVVGTGPSGNEGQPSASTPSATAGSNHGQAHSAPSVQIGAAREQPANATGRRVRATAILAAGALALAAVVWTAKARQDDNERTATETPVIAIGRIADHRQDRSTKIVEPLTDMLATAMARSASIRVVSAARMYELTGRSGAAVRDTSPDVFAAAARAAGASELLDGALYALDDGTLRLDLRRIDLGTGNVRKAHSVVARGPFALADSGTARLLADLGADTPAGSIADVTTRSLAAYRFYDEGLRAFYQDDLAAAKRLFTAALQEDTAFAAAAYYLSLSLRGADERNALPVLERAVRLAKRASDRERLTIQARWDLSTSSPALRASAESLLTRFPHEVDGYLFTGIVRVADGQFLDAVRYLERTIAMDSLSLHGGRAVCNACEAFRWLVAAYSLADSLALAEREARRWQKLQPRSGLVYSSLVDVLMNQGRTDDAVAVWRERSALAPGREADADVVTRVKLQGGMFADADELMRGVLATGTPMRRANAYWLLTLSYRYQGRLAEALLAAREQQRFTKLGLPEAAPPAGGIAEAQVLFELGRYREAAALFDAIAHWTPATLPASAASGALGRHRAWHLTHAADALAAVGDTAGLASRADTVQRYGAESAYRLHRQLHHHVRGLLLAARRRDDEAIEEFRQAMYSPTSGFTRTNYELARALLRRGAVAEAISSLQPALRGGVEASNYYMNATELHELLAQAWDTLGSGAGGARLPTGVSARAARDSAGAHYDRVARAWARGDSAFAARAARARARVGAFGR